MQNLLKSYFIQSSNRYVLFLQRFDEECRLFRRDSFSLSPGRSRPSSGQSACGLSRPPTNQSVPSVARRPGAEASIKGFLSHVEGRGIEVAKVGCSIDHVARNWIEGLATRDTMSHLYLAHVRVSQHCSLATRSDLFSLALLGRYSLDCNRRGGESL